MKKIKISQFHNGQSESESNTNTSFNSQMGGFDIYTDTGKLIQQKELQSQTLGSDNIEIHEVGDVMSTNFGSYPQNYTIGFGYESGASAKAFLFQETAEGNWSKETGATYALNHGKVILYREKPHLLTTLSNGVALEKFDSLISSSLITTHTGTTVAGQMHVHPLDDILYYSVDNTIYYYNGTTAGTGIVLPTSTEITSLTDYGGYLAIGCTRNGKSNTFLWGRDRSLTTLQENVDWGVGELQILENLGNVLYGVSDEVDEVGYKLTVRAYAGGTAEIIKEIYLNDLSSGGLANKKKVGNKLFFTVRNSDTMYAFYKNKEGRFTLTKSYFLRNGESVPTVYSISFVGNRLFTTSVGDSGRKFLSSRSAGSNYTDASYYETTLNAGMEAEDVAKEKKLERIYILGRLKRTTGIQSAVRLYYSLDGGAWVKLIDESGYNQTKTFFTFNEADGTTPNNFTTIKFKAEAENNAEILEISYTYQVISTNI